MHPEHTHVGASADTLFKPIRPDLKIPISLRPRINEKQKVEGNSMNRLLQNVAATVLLSMVVTFVAARTAAAAGHTNEQTDSRASRSQAMMAGARAELPPLHHHGSAETRTAQTMFRGIAHAAGTGTCNSGCIPEHVKLKDGQPLCCRQGHKSLKCPRPAHYQCGPHSMDTAVFDRTANATAAAAVVGSANPSEYY